MMLFFRFSLRTSIRKNSTNFPVSSEWSCIQQVDEDRHPFHPVGQQEQHIGLVQAGPASGMMIPDKFDTNAASIEHGDQLDRKCSVCRRCQRPPPTRAPDSFAPQRGCLPGPVRGNIQKHFFLQSQLSHLEGQGSKRSHQLLKDTPVVDMERHAKLLRRRQSSWLAESLLPIGSHDCEKRHDSVHIENHARPAATAAVCDADAQTIPARIPGPTEYRSPSAPMTDPCGSVATEQPAEDYAATLDWRPALP